MNLVVVRKVCYGWIAKKAIHLPHASKLCGCDRRHDVAGLARPSLDVLAAYHETGKIESLVDLASPLVGELVLARPDMSAATVAAAIRTRAGNTYTGVCIDVSCGMGGSVPRHAAVAEYGQGS